MAYEPVDDSDHIEGLRQAIMKHFELQSVKVTETFKNKAGELFVPFDLETDEIRNLVAVIPPENFL